MTEELFKALCVDITLMGPQCIEKFGNPIGNVEALIEEMAEATVAFQHAKRGRESNLNEEVADVIVSILCCTGTGDINSLEVLEQIQVKSQRLRARLDDPDRVQR